MENKAIVLIILILVLWAYIVYLKGRQNKWK